MHAHGSDGRVDRQHPIARGLQAARFDQSGHRSDGAVHAHLHRPASIHEYKAQVRCRVGGWDNHRAEHHEVAARLPHQGAAQVAVAVQQVARSILERAAV